MVSSSFVVDYSHISAIQNVDPVDGSFYIYLLAVQSENYRLKAAASAEFFLEKRLCNRSFFQLFPNGFHSLDADLADPVHPVFLAAS